MKRATQRWQISTSLTLFFCFFCFLVGLSRIRFQFIRIGDFCRLGSYTGDNTPPSSYSPSCPSQTLQSPSVTSPSDRRRPLGLCQDWVMCEQCWTGTREKKTLETRWVRRVNLWWFIIGFPFLLGKNMPGYHKRRVRRENNWKKRRSGVITETKALGEGWQWVRFKPIQTKAKGEFWRNHSIEINATSLKQWRRLKKQFNGKR